MRIRFAPNSPKAHYLEWKVGAPHVKLTPEQAKLITGNKSNLDVYEQIEPTTVKLP